MSSFTSLLHDHIRKVAGRESKRHLVTIKKIGAEHRRELAALKREHSLLSGRLAKLENGNGAVVQSRAAHPADRMRFRVDGIKSHRARLGLSALDFGKLVGVSGLTVYNWESGKAKPRRTQLVKIALVRGLGKREALKRLVELNGKAK